MTDATDKPAPADGFERILRMLMRGRSRDEDLSPVGDAADRLPRADIERVAKDSRRSARHTPGGPSGVEDFRCALLGEDDRTRQCRTEGSGRSGGIGGEHTVTHEMRIANFQ
jgi:hypothetical protein